MNRLVALGFTLVFAAACKTGNSSSSEASMPPGAVGLPMQNGGEVIASLKGASAEAMYNAFNVKEDVAQGEGRKVFKGRFAIVCSKEGEGGTIPPGAQGIMAPAVFRCDFTEPFEMPDGAQGSPAAPFVSLQEDAAADLYNQMKARPTTGQGFASKTWSGTGTVGCYHADEYECEMAGTPGGGSQPAAGVVISMTGEGAKAAYAALIAREVSVSGGKQKAFKAEAIPLCQRTGGSLPPGARGFPSPAITKCTITPTFDNPGGVQTTRPLPILTLTGNAANAFWSGFSVEETEVERARVKTIDLLASFICTYKARKYTCEGIASPFGMPPGAQGLPVMPE
jgi:hypothetical protein